jgi:hypothetical protein
MTPKVWGPPVWIFLHTFSVNISEYGYSKIGMQFYAYLTRICRLLPCPECAEHATKFISSIKSGMLKTKYDMANMLCNFHNSVNSRKRLPHFNNALLPAYENVSIITAFNNFVKAFTLPSQRLMNENLHRKMLTFHLQKFIHSNLFYFVKQKPFSTLSTTQTSITNEPESVNHSVSIDNETLPSIVLPNITYDILVDEIVLEEQQKETDNDTDNDKDMDNENEEMMPIE